MRPAGQPTSATGHSERAEPSSDRSGGTAPAAVSLIVKTDNGPSSMASEPRPVKRTAPTQRPIGSMGVPSAREVANIVEYLADMCIPQPRPVAVGRCAWTGLRCSTPSTAGIDRPLMGVPLGRRGSTTIPRTAASPHTAENSVGTNSPAGCSGRLRRCRDGKLTNLVSTPHLDAGSRRLLGRLEAASVAPQSRQLDLDLRKGSLPFDQLSVAKPPRPPSARPLKTQVASLIGYLSIQAHSLRIRTARDPYAKRLLGWLSAGMNWT